MTNYTFVINCAVNMPSIVGASVYTNFSQLTKTWMVCTMCHHFWSAAMIGWRLETTDGHGPDCCYNNPLLTAVGVLRAAQLPLQLGDFEWLVLHFHYVLYKVAYLSPACPSFLPSVYCSGTGEAVRKLHPDCSTSTSISSASTTTKTTKTTTTTKTTAVAGAAHRYAASSTTGSGKGYFSQTQQQQQQQSRHAPSWWLRWPSLLTELMPLSGRWSQLIRVGNAVTLRAMCSFSLSGSLTFMYM